MSTLGLGVSPSGPSQTRVKLLVGERVFHTTKQTLTSESTYFSSLLSGRWAKPGEDGAYFIDADPSLFEHILRYLRHSICPIFYDQANGHDLGLYVALLGEANYFGIPRLQKWLQDKKYLEAVESKHTVRVVEEWPGDEVTADHDTTVELHPKWDTKKEYICPRGIYVHRGDPLRCGMQCRKAQGDGKPEYQDVPILHVVVVKKQTIMRPEVCMP
ncbi:hypothetical protein E4U54_005398 [Claviceps lovelessii]|nr:hypothetical protein E4U54_005398 [Claviceps lovelessii]